MLIASKNELTSEMYQQEGQAYVEIGMYDEAILALTNAIRVNPDNKDAYFDRAYAYFELGQFEEALTDYVQSEKSKTLSNTKLKVSEDFGAALLIGLKNGTIEKAVEFFPSLYGTASGLSEVLWYNALHPIDSKIEFFNSCYEVGCCVQEYYNDFNWDTVEDYSHELKEFCNQYYNLSNAEKGEKFGHLVGKYGSDIFLTGGALMKGVVAVKNLKKANAICNLEAMTLSQTNKNIVIASATDHASKRLDCFKNVKLVIDSQNKHIEGMHNYLKGRSIFQHKDPQGLLRKYAGTGRALTKEIPGAPSYKEIVDFKEHIGIYKNELGTISLPTTKGTIHYSKKGAHIVPAHPDTLTK